MPRVSRKQADQHRIEVIEAASRLIPERGIDGVSVPALMAQAGLTHGAFYGHFPSKDALVVAACDAAFEEKRKFYDDILSRHRGDGDAARQVFIKRYTRTSHRDERAEGCPMAALCGDVGREGRKGPIRAAFAAGVNSLLERMSSLLSRGKKKASREEVLTTASLLVGALVLSRATEGHPVSEEFLAAARKVLLED
ncbi:TetR/AcrR family transcriptional regulator [Hyphomicrobium sp.]|uniref:TetR/AcrR family transcriptional regulator n=1 Tax=Hyphomicrobium sp. TaxID=82 RepID=UPI002E367B46|nr:TetR/AcrR family transcriptional regulator [Hyphomicrobium sp.]HEX2841822.1 TetR/AcrR family transcriptional regulator [Hyphomicrobium sp.]